LQSPISVQKPPHKPGQTTTKTYILMKTIIRISLMYIQLENKQHIRTLNLVFWTIIQYFKPGPLNPQHEGNMLSITQCYIGHLQWEGF
jgi:hypothetical protein